MLRHRIVLFFMDEDVNYARRLAQALLSGEILTVPERSVVISALSRGVILNASAVWTKIVQTSDCILTAPRRTTVIHVGAPTYLIVERRRTTASVELRSTQCRVPPRMVSCDAAARVIQLSVPARRVTL